MIKIWAIIFTLLSFSVSGQDLKQDTTKSRFPKSNKSYDFKAKEELHPFISVPLKYPLKAKLNQIEGKVTVKVTYANCEPVNYEIIEDIGYGCAEELIRALKEHRALEIKNGVPSKKCDIIEELRSANFKIH